MRRVTDPSWWPERPLAHLAVIAAVFAAATVLFKPILSIEFLSDDWIFLHAAAKARSLADVGTFFSFQTHWFVRPAQWILGFALFQLFGLNPTPYHLASVVLHTTNTILLAILIWRCAAALNIGRDALIITAWTSAFFLVQPQHHESIVWFSAINEPLRMCFCLLCLLLVTSLAFEQQRRRRTALIIGALASMCAALLCKESSVLLPGDVALIVGVLALSAKRAELRWRALFIVGALLAVLSGAWVSVYLVFASPDAPVWKTSDIWWRTHSSPIDWVLRSIQFFNIHFPRLELVNRHLHFLVLELLGLGAVVVAGISQRKFLLVLGFLWAIVSAIPYVLVFSADFQGSLLALPFSEGRYGYYSSAGAWLFGVSFVQWICDSARKQLPATITRAVSVAFTIGGVAFLALACIELRHSEQEWIEAGRRVHAILDGIRTDVPRPAPDSVLCFGGLPDNYHGRYMFRNGFAEAVRLRSYGRDDINVAGIKPSAQMFIDYPGLAFLHCAYLLQYDREAQLVQRVSPGQ